MKLIIIKYWFNFRVIFRLSHFPEKSNFSFPHQVKSFYYASHIVLCSQAIDTNMRWFFTWEVSQRHRDSYILITQVRRTSTWERHRRDRTTRWLKQYLTPRKSRLDFFTSYHGGISDLTCCCVTESTESLAMAFAKVKIRLSARNFLSSRNYHRRRNPSIHIYYLIMS